MTSTRALLTPYGPLKPGRQRYYTIGAAGEYCFGVIAADPDEAITIIITAPDIWIYDTTVLNSAGTAFSVYNLTGEAAISNSGFHNCWAIDSAYHGFSFIGLIDSASAVRCTSTRSAQVLAGHGFTGNVGSSVVMGAVVGQLNFVAFNGEFRTPIITFNKNPNRVLIVGGSDLTQGTAGSLAEGEWDHDGDYVYVQTDGSDPTAYWDITKMRVVAEQCNGLLWDQCVAEDTYLPTAQQEGHGFAFDGYTSTSTCRDCEATDNVGAGMQVNGGTDNVVSNVTLSGNGYSDSVLELSNTRNLTVI